MPFGLVYSALFFGPFCGWLGLRLVRAATAPPDRLGGILLILLGIALAIALLRREGWARWAGLAAAAAIAGHGLGSGDPVVLLAAAAAAVLLGLPATGRIVDGRPAASWLVGTVTLSAVGLVSLATASYLVEDAGVHELSVSPLPAALVRSPEWVEFEDGLALAAQQRRPVLVNFDASWCGYCRKMDRETWIDPQVVSRLAGLVPVKVDIDAEADLATRYNVQGTPTVLIVSEQGEVVARAGGFMDSPSFIDWLERGLRSIGGPDPVVPQTRVSGP